MLSTEASQTRWMSFHDHASRWDSRWHLELMTHSFAWWQQGKSPWEHCGSNPEESGDTTFSHRVNAWNVTGLNNSCCFKIFSRIDPSSSPCCLISCIFRFWRMIPTKPPCAASLFASDLFANFSDKLWLTDVLALLSEAIFCVLTSHCLRKVD